jgi:hypothetical protein
MTPPEDEVDLSQSWASLSGTGIFPLSAWSVGECHAGPDGQLRTLLKPDAPLIVGRQHGGETEYLDPRYKPTIFAPGSSTQTVLTGAHEKDNWVSRGHFMLRAHHRGILFVNGVPHRDGGIRPPVNFTMMLAPEHRLMHKGEEFLIEQGQRIKIALPNGSEIVIDAS